MKSPTSCATNATNATNAIYATCATYATYALMLAVVGLTACASPAPVSAPSQPVAFAVPNEAPLPPMMDRRETIMATGYAVIAVQNNKNAPQQRLLAIRAAKIDAYRGLAEQVYGLYLDANTIVSDMTIVSDAFRTRVEGVIFGATVTSINPLNNDTYEVTLSLNKSSINDLRVLYAEQLSGKRR